MTVQEWLRMKKIERDLSKELRNLADFFKIHTQQMINIFNNNNLTLGSDRYCSKVIGLSN